MALPASNTDLIAMTYEHYRPTFRDNVFTGFSFLAYMKSHNKVKVQGGDSICMVIETGQLATSGAAGSTDATRNTGQRMGFYEGYDALVVGPASISTRLVYDWRQHYGNVTIVGVEEALNKGKEQIMDLVSRRFKNAEKSISTQMETSFLQTTASTKDFNSIDTLVSNTGTVGGVDSSQSANSWWRSKLYARTGTFGRPDISKPARDVSRGGKDEIDLILTNSKMYDAIEGIAFDKVRFVNKKMVDLGFDSIKYRNATVLWTDNTALDAEVESPKDWSDSIYFLNTEDLYLVCHSSRWLDREGPIMLPGRDAKYHNIFSLGNLVCERRAGQARSRVVAA